MNNEKNLTPPENADEQLTQAAEEAVKKLPAENTASENEKKSKKEKKPFNAKKLKHGTMATVLTAVFLAVLVLLNVVATILFDKYPISIDLTENNVYSISDETKEYLKTLDRDVLITVLATESEFTSYSAYTLQADNMLKDYEKRNSHISVRYVDYLSNPDVMKDYDDELNSYDIIVETNTTGDDGENYKRTKILNVIDLVNFSSDLESNIQSYYGATIDQLVASYGADRVFQQFSSAVESSNAEQAFTSAILAVTDPNPVHITFLTGRDEADTLTYFQTLLEANGYVLDSIDITSEEIPEDTDFIVMAAPEVDYTKDEIKKVSDFLSNDGNLGKNLLYLASLTQGDTPNIDEFLEEYGITVEPAAIMETNSSYYFSSNPYYTAQFIVSDEYTDDMQNTSGTLFVPMARPITQLFTEQDMNGTKALVQSSSTAEAVSSTDTTDVVASGAQTSVVDAYKGKFGTETDEEGNYLDAYSHILAIGSVSFLDDSILKYSSQYLNTEYILSLMSGITGKTADITITPKTITGNLYDINDKQVTILKWIFTAIIPIGVLITGLVIWLKRKNK